jgi:hypothetical protein
VSSRQWNWLVLLVFGLFLVAIGVSGFFVGRTTAFPTEQLVLVTIGAVSLVGSLVLWRKHLP